MTLPPISENTIRSNLLQDWEACYGATWKGRVVKYLHDSTNFGILYFLCQGLTFLFAKIENVFSSEKTLSQIMFTYAAINQPKFTLQIKQLNDQDEPLRNIQERTSKMAVKELTRDSAKTDGTIKKVVITDFVSDYLKQSQPNTVPGSDQKIALGLDINPILAAFLERGFKLISPDTLRSQDRNHLKIDCQNACQNLTKDDQVVIIHPLRSQANAVWDSGFFPVIGSALEVFKNKLQPEFVLFIPTIYKGFPPGAALGVASKGMSPIFYVKEPEPTAGALLHPKTCGTYTLTEVDR